MDPHYLPVLADKDSLQRGEVPVEFEEEGIAAAELRSKQAAVGIKGTRLMLARMRVALQVAFHL